jgi:hypothetical protein
MRSPFVFFSSSARLLIALAAIVVSSFPAQAENLPSDHPTVELVKKYFQYVVEQNWKDAATMIRPSSIERKKKETIAIIKSASTMSEEAAMLAKLGVKDLRELEKMSVEEFYVADRQSFHNLARNNEEILKQKKASLKVDVLGVVGEQNGAVAHLAVRTSQEVMDQRINELFFISFTQDTADKSKWQIAPDMQRPVTEPVNKDGAAAPATEKK